MRKLAFLFVLFVHLPLSADMIPEAYVNHAWVDGVYWNQHALPGWGFFVDVQEETMFGAIYGYTNGAPTFITLQGNLISDDPMRYSGNVYSVTNNGSTATDVGAFTWEVSNNQASPAATLTISSNILNQNNLSLVRFSYAEDDKVDMFTAADWDIVTRILSISFADSFAITDERYVEDGITLAVLFDNADPEQLGLIGYYPSDQGDIYAMLIEFDSDTDEFFIFYASDTEMFGRGWLVDDGEDITGNGYYFHGAADTYQRPFQALTQSHGTTLSVENSYFDPRALSNIRTLKSSVYSEAVMEPEAMFLEATVRDVYMKLNEIYKKTISGRGPITAD